MIVSNSFFPTAYLFSLLLNDPKIPYAFKEIANTEYIYFLSIFLLNVLSYLYIIIKFYKVFCYAKMTCDWFPMLNQYQWPFSFFRIITAPYFSFWGKVLPSIKFKRNSIEISGIIGVEALNAIVYFCVRGVNFLIVILMHLDADKIAMS